MMRARSAENWVAGTSHGTALTFELAANGTTTLTERMRIEQNGNVGIGSTVPATKLEVKGTGRFINATTPTSGEGLEIDYAAGDGRIVSIDRTNALYKDLNINANQVIVNDVSGGNVGIGTTNPAAKLDVNGSATIRGPYSNLCFRNDVGSNQFQMGLVTVPGAFTRFGQPGDFTLCKVNSPGNLFITNLQNGAINFSTGTTYGDENIVMSVKGNNVLIGKTTQTNSAYKLDVAGFVRADKLVVNTTGADFVFEPNYILPSLQSVETFIKKFHHLPGIASAKEMQNNGLDVGEHQTNLLQKIEELTLYMIEIKKENEVLKQKIEALKSKTRN